MSDQPDLRLDPYPWYTYMLENSNDENASRKGLYPIWGSRF